MGQTPAEPGAVTDALLGMWQRSRPKLLARVDVLDEAVAELLGGSLDEAPRADAERSAHQLAGSAGTFGANEASRIARLLETAFAAAPGPDRGQYLAEQVVTLRAALEDPQVSFPAQRADDRLLPVHLVSDGPALAQRLQAVLAARGMRLLTGPDASEQPAAVLIDAASASWREETRIPRAVEGAPETAATPVLLLSTAGRVSDRVTAARAGVSGFLSDGLSDQQIADAVGDAAADARPDRQRVLACDDDPTMLAAVRALLAPVGVAVTTVEDPLEFWEALEASTPDLVLLDLDMPHVNGIELCRALRADPARATLPVMFLTASADAASVQAMFGAGADDIVTKPTTGLELAGRVHNRLDRIRAHRRLADTDGMTGLLNRRASHDRIGPLLVAAARSDEPAALAVLDLDRFKQINNTFGRLAGDAALQSLAKLLRERFRDSDISARWGGDEFVLIMAGIGRHDALQRVAELLEELRDTPVCAPDGRPIHVTFSAGIAEYPADGDDILTLYQAADEALDAAKRTGGDRVLDTVRAAATAPECDVVLVEDDDTLAELLLHALHTRGYRAVWIADGADALRRLRGDDADLRPAVMLLDVGLPGLSGLDLLRALKAAGTLDRTRVIMLTARAGEPEVLEALRLGAVDHVAKPFSVPVLLERIRHAQTDLSR